MKATYGEVNGEPREIFKNPITDDGTKRSLKGLLSVHYDYGLGKYVVIDRCTWDEEKDSDLALVYKDGKFLVETSLKEIRKRLVG